MFVQTTYADVVVKVREDEGCIERYGLPDLVCAVRLVYCVCDGPAW